MESKVKTRLDIKRIADILFAIVLLTIFSPLIFLLLIISFLSTGEYPLFRQSRTVANLNKTFKIIKIRTMKSVPEKNYSVSNFLERKDLLFRVPLVGKWMRRTGLDELPQLINVLRGEMSIVGPRPLSLQDIEILKNHYPNLYERRKAITSTPGLTGYWQVYGERNLGVGDLIEKDEFYEIHKSPAFDSKILFMTIPIVVFALHSDSVLGEKYENKEHKTADNISDILITK